MENFKKIAGQYILFAFMVFGSATVHSNTVLQHFKGSTEKGMYKSDFVSLNYAKLRVNKVEIKTTEGKLLSRILLKPKNKNNLELYRSYQQTLKKAGFTILHTATPKKNKSKLLVNKLYLSNGLSRRKYINTTAQVSLSDLDRIRMFGDYYLSAVKQEGNARLYAVVVISREKNLYLIDELTVVSMEKNTVVLNLDAMKNAIADTGKIAVYDLYFETDSAKITAQSNQALKTIAQYLKQDKYNYYIVGHTDDTGNLKHNLSLSQQRAAAVTKNLIKNYHIKSGRLQARGVGPLSPISNNTSEQGRALNRRVEIVRNLN